MGGKVVRKADIVLGVLVVYLVSVVSTLAHSQSFLDILFYNAVA